MEIFDWKSLISAILRIGLRPLDRFMIQWYCIGDMNKPLDNPRRVPNYHRPSADEVILAYEVIFAYSRFWKRIKCPVNQSEFNDFLKRKFPFIYFNEAEMIELYNDLIVNESIPASFEWIIPNNIDYSKVVSPVFSDEMSSEMD